MQHHYKASERSTNDCLPITAAMTTARCCQTRHTGAHSRGPTLVKLDKGASPPRTAVSHSRPAGAATVAKARACREQVHTCQMGGTHTRAARLGASLVDEAVAGSLFRCSRRRSCCAPGHAAAGRSRQRHSGQAAGRSAARLLPQQQQQPLTRSRWAPGRRRASLRAPCRRAWRQTLRFRRA